MGLFQLSGSPAGHVTTTATQQVGEPLRSGAVGQLNQTMGGNYLYGNPGFNAAQQAAYNQITPQVQSAFSRGGRLNSGLAQVGMTQALGDSFAGLYNNERNRQLQAASIAPSITSEGTQSEPYFENDLASLLGLLAAGGGLLGLGGNGGSGGGLGGLIGSIGDGLGLTGPGGLLSGLFGGGSGLDAGGAADFFNGGTGSGLDLTGTAGVNNSGGPGLGNVPTPPASSVTGGSTSGLGAGANIGDVSGLNLGGLGSGAFGVANALGPNVLGFGGGGVSGVSLGGAGALDLSGVAGGVTNSLGGAAGGLSGGGAAPGLGSFAGAALPLAGLAAMGGLIMSGKGKIAASKAAKEKLAMGLYETLGPQGGTVNLPGVGQKTILPMKLKPGEKDFWNQMNRLETSDGGYLTPNRDGTWNFVSKQQRKQNEKNRDEQIEAGAKLGLGQQVSTGGLGLRLGSQGGR